MLTRFLTNKATLFTFRFLERPSSATLIFLLAFALTLFAASLLQSCAATPALNTFNKQLAAGYSSVTAARDTTATLLAAQKISIDDARRAQSLLNDARVLLDTARSLRDSNPKEGGEALSKALSIIATAQAFLNRQSASYEPSQYRPRTANRTRFA